MKSILTKLDVRFQMYPKVNGNPDFIINDKKIAVFCDGDFWHGYRYDQKKKPAKRFWRNKIEGNMARDSKISRKMRLEGWSVLRFWEHDIEKNPEKCKNRILRKINERRQARTAHFF